MTRRTQGTQVFNFNSASTNIYQTNGKDLEFFDTNLRRLAQNNQETHNFLEQIERTAQEEANRVIESTKAMVKERNYDEAQLSYLAGFLDGDGTINISTSEVPRARGYRFLHKHQITVSYIQKDRRKELLEVIKTSFNEVGTIRQQGQSRVYEYNMTDENVNIPLLKLLLPYLRVKKRQATLAILFAEIPKRNLNAVKFLERAMLVDLICYYNDSRSHTHTAYRIKETLIAQSLITAEEIERTKFVVHIGNN